MGRVLATSIAPPHNIDSIKHCLAKHEDIDLRHQSTSLFLTKSHKLPMDDTSKIIIVKHTGTGSAPQEAVALVVKLPDRITEWGECPALVSDVGPSECGKKFVLCFHHYSLWLMSCPIICKSTTGCTMSIANCHQEHLSTWSNLQLGASGSIGLHHLIQLPL